MHTLIVTELALSKNWQDDQHVCYHKFNLPAVGEAGFYRDRMSCNAFFHSCKVGRNRTKTRLFVYRHENEPAFYFDKTLPMIEHANIWDFYKNVGYDYKKKAWLKPNK